MMTLRVATWNVLSRHRMERIALLSEHVRQVQPDVLLLQESGPVHARALARACDMEMIVVAEDDPEAAHDEESISAPAILARVRTGNPTVVALPSATERRFSLVTASVMVGNSTVTVASTHLQHTNRAGDLGISADYRRLVTDAADPAELPDKQMRDSVVGRLAQLSHALPRLDARNQAVILGGDFNFLPHGPEWLSVLAAGLDDAWQAAPRLGSGATILENNPLVGEGPDAYRRQVAATRGGRQAPNDYTLDFQFYSRPAAPGDAWTIGHPTTPHGAWASDHLGLVVNYTITSPFTGPAR